MNLIDYLEWRGDLPLKKYPFCEVDALVLCQLSYLNFDSLVSPDVKNKIPLSLLWQKFRQSPDFEKRSDLGALISESTVKLLELCAKSERFKNIEAAAYVNKIDLKNEEQFSAVTFFERPASKNPFVAFRGTDDNIVGWKEDFNLATKIVPAQRDSVEYLAFVAKASRGKIFVGGHSKGGNLALYSSAFVDGKTKKRIACIYNFDGPGFSEELVQSKEMQKLIPMIRSYYPKFSIVGMLFRHTGSFEVVESEAFAIMQHEPFSWHIKSNGFETISELDKASELFYKTFNEWVEGLSTENRELFVETLFEVISASGARTNRELERNWYKTVPAILKAMGKVDKDTREKIMLLLGHFFDTAAKNLTQN